MSARLAGWVRSAQMMPTTRAALAGTAALAGAGAAGLMAQPARTESVTEMLEKINAKLEKLEAVATEKSARKSAATASGHEKMLSTVGVNGELIEMRSGVYESIKGIGRIPELDYVPTRRYAEATTEEILYPMIEANQVRPARMCCAAACCCSRLLAHGERASENGRGVQRK